jgi:hypothetical protein
MRRMAILGAVAAVLGYGCALESSETESEPATGDVPEAASTFTAPWSTSHYLRTRPIMAPLGGSIVVRSKADFADHVGCPSSYSVELIHLIGSSEEVVSIARAYPLNQWHSEIWAAPARGTYRVQFSTTEPPGKCELRGTVTVSVTP